MSKELFEKGFSIETTIKGVAVAIRPANQNSEKKGAQLQFATITNKGLQTIDVKVEASREEDLQKFINQYVVITNVNVSKVDFNTYYSCPDISLVKIENIKGA
ncbi:hypothetical protein AFAEC_1766 [Aliarcobacter faecis]|uniref:hypothetical protein n=1 Tax=Aliarcobacter faecis TaxID=1564138 RepID=UPI00047B17AC|nr:hypothetical protein [Aliarcobacter faecis]QKF73918.1 hypothetical protein AFAEC_1766 [Aliarcobacter faecis]